MAQIRKFKPGGKTPNEIGVLTIDGKEYTGDGFIQHMRDYRKTLDDKVADQFGNIINALEAGENLQYDSDTDILTGNVDWNVSKSQEKRLNKGEDRTKVGKVFGALNEGKEQRVRYAINALRGMPKLEMRVIEPEKPESKSYDWSKQISLNYTLNNNKSRTVSMLGNTQVTDRLNQLKDVFGDTWSENDKLVGYNNNTKEHYKKFYDAHKDNLDAIIKRIETGTWTDDDLLILTDLGIIDSNQQTQTPEEKKVGSSSIQKNNIIDSVNITNNDGNAQKVNNNDTKEREPSITDEIIQAYEAARKINKRILQDTTSREERKNTISPTNRRGRITKLRFDTKTIKPNLTAIRQRNIDELLTRLEKNKEKDTIIKYEIPLWYKRDTSNITYIKHGGIIKADKGWKYDINYNPYVGRSIYPTEAADLAPDLYIPSFVEQPHSSTITFPKYQAYKGIKRPILVGRATEFKDFDTPFNFNIPAVMGFVDLSNIRLFTDYNSNKQTNVSQSTDTPNANQTLEENAGEAPPKWKQDLKEYTSRAFNYENLNTLGQVIGAVAANHKVAKVKENALKSMPLSRNVFQASTPAYYENTRGFDVRRNALLNTQLPQTADAKLNAQWKLNILSELDKVNREKYDYLSQNRNQYNQFVNQIENKNRELRVAESNAFIDRLSQRDMALAENTAGMIANDFKTFEQALKKGLYNYQQDRAVYDQLALSDRKKMLFNKYSEKATNWAKTNKPAENEIYMSDIDRYFKYNPGDKDQYDNDIMQLNRLIYRPRSIWSPQFDKGGKLSAQDHIKINKHKSQDRILENKYKAIDKAVQKLNDNVIKIFLNMMK